MKILKILKWLVFVVYIFFAIIWASTAGHNHNELLHYDGNKLYMNKIIEVTKSYQTNSGMLVLCLKGYLGDSRKYRVTLSDFSVVIPLNDFKNQKEFNDGKIKLTNKSKIILLSDNAIINECKEMEKENSIIQIYHVKKNEGRAINEYKYIENLDINEREDLIILAFPNYTYSGGLYPKVLDLYIVGKESDVMGRKYYALMLEESLIYREISTWEYSKAFAKDFILFPIQVYQFLSWH